jgi:Zn-dependent alcohol dehydrogenase
VRIVATGTCLTDAIARDQAYLVAQLIVLGYEWAGIVEAVEDWIIKVPSGGSCRPYFSFIQ